MLFVPNSSAILKPRAIGMLPVEHKFFIFKKYQSLCKVCYCYRFFDVIVFVVNLTKFSKVCCFQATLRTPCLRLENQIDVKHFNCHRIIVKRLTWNDKSFMLSLLPKFHVTVIYDSRLRDQVFDEELIRNSDIAKSSIWLLTKLYGMAVSVIKSQNLNGIGYTHFSFHPSPGHLTVKNFC